MTRREKRKNYVKILLISNIVLFVLVIVLLISNIVSCSKSITTDTESEEIKKNFHETSYSTSNGETVLIQDTEYEVKPGTTFYLDKGNLKLFLDVVPSKDGTTLTVTGREFHMDKELLDGAISGVFTLNMTTKQYENSNKDIFIENYTGISLDIIDYRSVSLKFSGTLNLISSIAGYDNQNNVPVDASNMASVNIATAVPDTQVSEADIPTKLADGDIIVNEYNENGNTSGIIADIDFEDSLIASNERKKFTITAKYIKSASNSGTLYKEIHSGKEFYAFGSKFPYNESECNTVTIIATYRGNEKHFNGLEMGDIYPCFVIDSIRKPTASEVQ